VSDEPDDRAQAPLVQSVDRAVTTMEILAREGWAGVSEIARELGIHKSTAYRLLATLERRGLVEQHDQTQQYRLGFALVAMAGSVRSSLDLVRAARPACDRLARTCHETVNLAVLEGPEVVNIEHVNHSGRRVSVDWLGSHTALHCTSSGKVFLAYADPELRAELLGDAPLERFTPATVTEPDTLQRELERARARGFATTSGEIEEGLNAVAAPVRAPDGEVVASISVSGPSYRLTTERLDELAPRVVAAADDVSWRLGFLGDPRFGRHDEPDDGEQREAGDVRADAAP
jgi:IclR family transcriptional regulator, acetate operon repressor